VERSQLLGREPGVDLNERVIRPEDPPALGEDPRQRLRRVALIRCGGP
jgi:hypothetical protein